MRLGVSPSVASTPTGVFNQRFEALFPRAGALGWVVCFTPPAVPPGLSMCKCGAAGSASHHLVGSASCSLAHPVPQSTTSLGPTAATFPGVLSVPSMGLDECVFFNSLVVRLPYSLIFCQFWLFFLFLNCCCPSFGCARSHSGSTYASILAGGSLGLIFKAESICIMERIDWGQWARVEAGKHATRWPLLMGSTHLSSFPWGLSGYTKETPLVFNAVCPQGNELDEFSGTILNS